MDVDLDKAEIKDAIRLGPKKAGYIRPLKVMLQNIQVKREILGKAKLLNSGKYKNVYINPDLTPQQRDKDRLLRQELKKRRDNGESDVYINKGKIVERRFESETEMPDLAPPRKSSSESDIYIYINSGTPARGGTLST